MSQAGRTVPSLILGRTVPSLILGRARAAHSAGKVALSGSEVLCCLLTQLCHGPNVTPSGQVPGALNRHRPGPAPGMGGLWPRSELLGPRAVGLVRL